MVTAISDVRIAPVGEDLTTEETRLSILRGLERMHRVDKPYDTNASFVMGEWAVLNASGKLERAGATPVPNTYLVFAGTDRFDAKATGQCTVIMGSQVIAKTSQYDDGASYAVGDYLTVKDLGGGESSLTAHTGGEVAVAKVVEVGAGYLVFETMSPVAVA